MLERCKWRVLRGRRCGVRSRRRIFASFLVSLCVFVIFLFFDVLVSYMKYILDYISSVVHSSWK